MSTSISATPLTTLTGALQPAWRCLRIAQTRRCLSEALLLLLWCIVAAAAVDVVAETTYRAGGATAPRWFHATLVGLLTAAAVGVAMRAGVTLRRRQPSWQEAAERLDAAHDDHNRIATAWSIAHAAVAMPFARAAIEAGLMRLREVASQPPALPSRPGRPTRRIVALMLAVVLSGWAVTYQFLAPPHHGASTGDALSPAAVLSPQVARHGASADPDDRSAPRSPRDRADTSSSRAGAAGGRTSIPAAAQTPPLSRPQLGVDTQQVPAAANALSQSPGQTANRAGSSTTQKPVVPEGAPRGPRAPEQRARQAAQEREGDDTAEASSLTIATGGRGRGRGAAVKSHGLQRENATSEEEDAAEPGETPDDETEGATQRGGVQPFLPDRTAAPSRALGITGPQSGRPGTGRGGPSPVKKSRGTAALLMGVAVPDFLRGQPGPGPTALNVANVGPTRWPEHTAERRIAEDRVRPESVIRRFEVPWTEAATVQEYLSAWHQADRIAAVESREATRDRTESTTPAGQKER